MKNFSKYVTLNLVSILGYILLAFALVVIFYIFPKIQVYANASEKDFNAYAEVFMLCGGVVLISTIVELFLMLFVFPIEVFIYKFRKTNPNIIKIPENLSKVHFITLIIGIILSMIPIILSLYILVHSV